MPVDRRTILAAGCGLAAWPMRARAAERVQKRAAEPVLAAYERESGGRIGVHATNLATGADFSWRPDERFVMCSTFKASLAAFVLARIEAGRDSLEHAIAYGTGDLQPYAPVARRHLAEGAMTVHDMCKAVVELSDNTCANLLLAHVGGPAALTAFWRRTGDGVTRLDHDEPLLNHSPPVGEQDTTSPRAMAGTLRRLVIGDVLTPASRTRLTDWMVNCATGADRLRGGLPTGWKIGDKTGNNGADAFGDIAVAWPRPDAPVVICAYTQGGKPSPALVATTFAEIGRLVTRRLG